MRAQQPSDLHPRRRRQNLKPEHLDAAGRRAAAAADKHHDQQQCRGEPAPGREIGAGIAGAGHDRDGVEAGLPDRHADRHAGTAEMPDQDEHHGDEQGHEPPHLRVPQQRAPAAANDGEVVGKGKAADNHAGDHDPFDGHRIEGRDRGRSSGIAAGGDGGHGMGDGVEIAHPGDGQHDRPERRQAGIDDADAARQLRGAGHDLVGAVIGFGAEQLHAADRQHRQDGHRHDDDADTAKPLQQRPPDKNAGGCQLDLLQHGRPGGRDSRYRFEDGVGQAELQLAEHEGKGAEQADRDPGSVGQKKGLPEPQIEPLALRGGQPDGHADESRQQGRQGKDLPVGRAEIQVETHRDQHGRAENGRQQAKDVQHR